MEIVGIAIVLLAVDGIVGSFLPSGLLWIEGIICVSTVAPFIAAATAVILKLMLHLIKIVYLILKALSGFA
ncbi:hypothetical protein LIER_03615 [Lithospermum erythrorhizon]|uniref:Uncharacterized protein n=1 Tax=Lithospermum erythrorhizon TaxID=34254 RepID=A0AAV3NVG6_LITER